MIAQLDINDILVIVRLISVSFWRLIEVITIFFPKLILVEIGEMCIGDMKIVLKKKKLDAQKQSLYLKKTFSNWRGL